jgi:hypothetical protein
LSDACREVQRSMVQHSISSLNLAAGEGLKIVVG